MKTVTIKKAENGFVITVPNVDPINGPTEYVFSSWADVTTFLTSQSFFAGAE